MLVNIIQNTISSFRSALAAAEVITTNLKMWLGFETSETLGREEVDNGDFATDSDWNKNSNWSISGGVAIADGTTNGDINQGTTLAIIDNSYSITYEVVSISQGSFYFKFGGVSGAFRDEIGIYTEVIQAINTNRIALDSLNNAIGSVTNISVKKLTQITPDKSDNNNVGELFTGKALEFDGSTDYVSANGFAGTLSHASAFTFAIWFNSSKPNTASVYQNILLSASGPTQGTQVFKIGVNPVISPVVINGITYNPGGIYFYDSIDTNHILPSSGGIDYNDGEWHRIVVARRSGSGNKDLSFYVDGSLIGTAPCNPLWDNVNLFDFGQEWDGGGTSDHFQGKMSDIQVYDYAWTTDDIAYDYANPQNLVTDRSGTSITLSNLKGYWHLSEGAGSLVYDSSGEGNNGTINGATYEPAQPRIPQLGMMDWAKSTPVSDEVTLIPNPNNTSQDILGNAVRDRLNSLNLDGSGYAEVADDTDLDIGTGAFTMECWVKADFENTSSGFNNIFILGGEIGDTNTASISINSTKLLAQVSDKELTADSNYTIEDWYHVCVTRDGSNLCTLYIDAVAQADTETTSASITNTSTKQIGRDTLTTRFYKNLISDVRLYKDKALSATEVENNYNAGLSAHTN